MTASELKAKVLEAQPNSHFFDRKTMKFFGDTMANYGVCDAEIIDRDGMPRKVYELYRRKPVNHGVRLSAYFDCETLEQVHRQQAGEA